MEWISVKDRLPQEGDVVYVTNIKMGNGINHFLCSYWCKMFQLSDRDTGHEGIIPLEVTHWIKVTEFYPGAPHE